MCHLTMSVALLVSMTFFQTLASGAFVLVDDYSGETFFKSFEFFTDADPTNGHVKYKSMTEANATGLAGLMDGGNATKAIYMGVDTTEEAPEGRGSVRVSSKKSYQHALVIADIVHMPGGVCGSWPAFWMVGDDWPVNGEIDIVEGVNDQASNQMTLHTSAGPRISSKSSIQESFTGDIITQDCDVNAPDQSRNAGCAIADNTGLTFGNDFNTNGGGVYATEWTSQSISIWFFPRGKFPSDIASASPSPSQHWGPPNSVFTGDFNMDDHFKNLKIIFDTTFCGDWAGNTWNQSQCASLAPTCEEFVSKNPSAFTEAYWAINTLQVFQDDGIAGTAAAVAKANVDKLDILVKPTSESTGSFIRNAAVSHTSVLERGGLTVGNSVEGAAPEQPPPSIGWESKKRGGSVLPRRNSE